MQDIDMVNEDGIEQENIEYTGSKSVHELKEKIKDLCDDFDCEFFSNDFDFYDEDGRSTKSDYGINTLFYICYKMNKNDLILMKGGVDEEDYDEDSLEIDKFHIDTMPCPDRWGTYHINFKVNDDFYIQYSKEYGQIKEEKIAISSNDCYCAFDNLLAAKNFLSFIAPEGNIGVKSRMSTPIFSLSSDMFL